MWYLIGFLLICIIPCAIGYYIKKNKETAFWQEKKEERSEILKRFNDRLNQINMPNPKPPIVTILNGTKMDGHHWSYYIWVVDKKIHLFPASIDSKNSIKLLPDEKWEIISIPLERIVLYRQIGEITTTVSGSGGGSSFSIITGFHGKIEPIKIESSTQDNRTTQLFFDDGIKDCVLVFKNDDYYILKKIIPQKDYNVVNITSALQDNHESNDDAEKRLSKIKDLYEKGLISREEFEHKKKEILSEI